MVEGGIEEQTHQVFRNMKAVCEAAGATLQQLVKLTVFLTDFANYTQINSVMEEYIAEPFPARSAIGVASLPKNAPIEIEGILILH